MIEVLRDHLYCVWCGIRMRWWRVLTMSDHCRDCSVYRGYGSVRTHRWHSRVGMRE
jgi:hypothetical protein